MARIERSPSKSIVPPAPSAPPLVTPAPGGALKPPRPDDFTLSPMLRLPSGRYEPVLLPANPQLAGQLGPELVAARAGLHSAKTGTATGAATKAFSPATFARSLEGKSQDDVGAAWAALGTKERLALTKALQSGAVSSPRLLVATLNGLDSQGQQDLLKKLPPAALAALTASLRADPSPRTRVVVAVSIELASRTPWANNNADALNALRTVHADNKLMGGEKGGLGSYRDGFIRYADSLLRSPEALAAVLAHEALHARQGGAGAETTSPEGEAAGVLAQSAVWSAIGDPGDANLEAEHRTQLNKYAALARIGEKAVLKEVVSQYLARAKEKVAEREAKPSSARGDDDTAAAWKKYVEVYEKKLKSLESP
jgi:hypothetical protein